MKLLHRIFPVATGLTTANDPVAAVGTEKPNVTLKFMKMHKAYTLLVFLTVMGVTPAGAQIPENKAEPGNRIAYQDGALSFSIDGKNGHLLSFKNGREFVVEDEQKSLFALQFRNATGQPLMVDSSQATKFDAERIEEPGLTRFRLSYRNIAPHPEGYFERDIHATVVIDCPHDSGMTHWRIDVDFRSLPLEMLEFIEFPRLTLPNEFSSENGDLELFWPFSEGCLIDNPGARRPPYKPVEYPSGGWYGMYPGPLQMQYLSVQSPKGGLYMASHDPTHTPKEIEYLKTPRGVKLIYKVFTGAAKNSYHMPYPMVLGGFQGDWHDAARIYRDFATSGKVLTMPKLRDNPKMMAWMKESPVVCTYAVRGQGHHAGPTQPNKLFPFRNALPHLARYQKEFGTDLLNLLMQYEGTAPWSPPYVWPPMGGESAFREYVDALHAQGNIIGLYCSGTAWTQYSSTGDGNYDRRQDFKDLNLREDICTGPRGEAWSKVCNGDALRWGYDLCAARQRTADLLAAETKKMVEAGVDYVQLFDQNLGCAPYFCYSDSHGHPAGPGAWMVPAMRKLIKDISVQSGAEKKNVIFGCEAAAAEPFMENLPLNDLRFNQVLKFGKWVPAYAFVFHEYAHNFQGNQVETTEFLATDKGANHLLLRTAYSFAAGDLMTIVLTEKGDIHWAWCARFSVPVPDQDSIITLIRNLTAWRKQTAHPFLVYGRMEKPFPAVNMETVDVSKKDGSILKFDTVLMSRFQGDDGRDVQLLVNWQEDQEQVSIELPDHIKKVSVITRASGEKMEMEVTAKRITIDVPPLNAVLVEFQKNQ